jgi:hypothetical protein
MCKFILIRGINKGKQCSKKSVKDTDYCSSHTGKSVSPQVVQPVSPIAKPVSIPVVQSCKHVLTKGKNKGEQCSKKTIKDSEYCNSHKKTEKPIVQDVPLKPILKTEDLGKTVEYALCLLYGLEYTGNFKYDTDKAHKLKERFQGIKNKLKVKEFVGKTNNYTDFILKGGSGLSVKSNKSQSKIAPQIIGQTTKNNFKKHFNCDDKIKVFVKENLDRVLNEYCKYTFEQTLLYYNEKHDDLLIYKLKNQIKIEGAYFYNEKWRESATIKYKNLTIGEFQIHKNRNCVKFRFQLDNFIKLFENDFVIDKIHKTNIH